MIWLFVSAALAFDQEPWQAVLDHYVDARGRVDYAALHASHALDDYLAALATAPEPPAGPEREAFWINAYNALTVDLVADSWPVGSITALDGGKVWDTRHFQVAGQSVTLNHIEQDILRLLGDPRVHAAINCASLGCPPLAAKAFAPASLDSQLDAAARRWIATTGVHVDKAGNTVAFNQIFDWYGVDFASAGDVPGLDGKAEGAALFAARFAPAEAAAWLRAGGYQATWAKYDWGVNGK